MSDTERAACGALASPRKNANMLTLHSSDPEFLVSPPFTYRPITSLNDRGWISSCLHKPQQVKPELSSIATYDCENMKDSRRSYVPCHHQRRKPLRDYRTATSLIATPEDWERSLRRANTQHQCPRSRESETVPTCSVEHSPSRRPSNITSPLSPQWKDTHQTMSAGQVPC